jgi:hypothetical protein
MDLSTLPIYIRKKPGSKWFYNSKTGERIHESNIRKYIPKPSQSHEQIISKRWDLQK